MKNITKNISKIEKAGSECNSEFNMESKKYIVGILALFFSIALAWLILPIIVSLINPPMIDMTEMKNLVIPSVIKVIWPEPIERTMFVAGVVLLPILLLMFIYFFNYILKNVTDLLVIKYAHNVLFVVFLGSMAYLTWIANKSNEFVYFQNGIGFGFPAIIFIAFISLSMNLLIVSSQKNNIFNRLLKFISFLTNSMCWIIILSVFLMCVFGISLVSDMGTYNTHFNTVFHPVVQVFFGKGILYNLISQYGLFPYILEPIWRIIGLSVFKFTLVMGLLMGLSLILLYKLFKELIDNKIIGYLGFISLVWINYMFVKVIYMYRWAPEFIDSYFQFHPIRFLFPMISLYLTYYYLKTSSKKIYYISFVIYSISMIWNFDTGFVLYLTWLITLIYEGLCDRDIKKIIFHIVNWVLIFLITFGLFTLYMYLRYGNMPMYNELLYYQKMYFVNGFWMLPMPLIHPWNLVVIVYLIGMAISLINLLNKNKSLKVFMIFNLSILGVGVFPYYQGRSHDFVFITICYPAFILITIFADELIKKIRDNKSVINFIALNCITFFMIYWSISLVSNYEIIFKTLKRRTKISIEGKSTLITRNAEFIRDNTKKGEEILLLSDLSGIHYLESQTVSPIKSEPRNVFIISEEKDILNYINSNLCQKVFLDINCDSKTLMDFVKTNLKLSLVCPDRNIGIFIKKQ